MCPKPRDDLERGFQEENDCILLGTVKNEEAPWIEVTVEGDPLED